MTSDSESQDKTNALDEAIKRLQEQDPEKYEALMKRAKDEVEVEEEETHEEDYYWLTGDLMPDSEEEGGVLVEEGGWLPEDYLTQSVEGPSSSGTDKPRRFGRGSNAQPDNDNR